MANKRAELSIVIPAYREAKRIGKTLDALAAYLHKQTFVDPKEVEVIVVAADSPDNTSEIVQSKQKSFTAMRLLQPGPQVGKGRDVKVGMLAARGKAVLFMDADLATPLHHIEELYALYREGIDVVVATRDFMRYRHSYLRVAISLIGNFLFGLAGNVWIRDSQCGFKLFSARAVQLCFSNLHITGWGFDMEVLTIARANKLTIRTVRIHDWQAIPEGTFEENVLKNTLQSFKDLGYVFWRRAKRDNVTMGRQSFQNKLL